MKYLASLLLVLCVCSLILDALGSETKITKKLAKAAAKMAGKKTASRFFTAWTIITIVMLVIILAVFAYYLHMFYPLVCAKRGKYDVMEMAHV